ncbi:hypothetical protein MKW98_010607 [Papaver atlanticum]|uniref:Uncharacterized protein n=1 Tax=Papaver atlanticum TaxID=357466 RepID=A0AAD4X6N8_9MAGN|nr:hypothetical protein MKW98_010607 [Papaver atlanticum]
MEGALADKHWQGGDGVPKCYGENRGLQNLDSFIAASGGIDSHHRLLYLLKKRTVFSCLLIEFPLSYIVLVIGLADSLRRSYKLLDSDLNNYRLL